MNIEKEYIGKFTDENQDDIPNKMPLIRKDHEYNHPCIASLEQTIKRLSDELNKDRKQIRSIRCKVTLLYIKRIIVINKQYCI